MPNTASGDAVAIDPQYGVGVPRRQEVEFHDGSRLWLHRVEQDGSPSLFKRALQAPDGPRVDLRHLVPELANDLPIAETRDVPGIIHYSLRGNFKSAAGLLDQAQRCAA